MKRVFVVHGWKSKPSSNWFPWLRAQLRLWPVEVQVLSMPDPEKPKREAWVKTIVKAVRVPDEDTFFVGHSLGGIAILRYLESLPKKTRVGGIVLVAGFPEPINRPEITTFFEKPLDYGKIRKIVRSNVVAIQSTNDPYVPFEHGKKLRDALAAKLIVIESGGHLNSASGHDTLPVVLTELIELGC